MRVRGVVKVSRSHGELEGSPRLPSNRTRPKLEGSPRLPSNEGAPPPRQKREETSKEKVRERPLALAP